MTDDPLRAALDDLRAAHRSGGGWQPECVTCRQTWPCTAAESEATIRAALASVPDEGPRQPDGLTLG